MDIKSRFLKFVRKTPTCWLWTGALHQYGYGMFEMKIAGKWRAVQGHRAAWMIFKGEIPEGLQVLHGCDTPACVNTAHLRLGTHQDNMNDRRARKTHPHSKRTQCNNGHPFTKENTYVHPTKGYRMCRRCRVIQQQRSDAKKKVATK